MQLDTSSDMNKVHTLITNNTFKTTWLKTQPRSISLHRNMPETVSLLPNATFHHALNAVSLYAS